MPNRSQPLPRYAQAFLSRPAASIHRWAALGAACVILGVTLWGISVASTPIAPMPAFLPMTIVAMVLSYGFTSLLLGLQSNQLRHPTLALLAGAYSFTAVVYFIQLLMFPGALAEHGLLGASPQSAPWLNVLIQIGFPLWVLVAILQFHQARTRFTLLSAWWVPTLCAPICALLLALLNDLPKLVINDQFTSTLISWLAPIQTLLYAGVLIGLMKVTRLRTRLHLWLAIVLLAMLASVVLSATAGFRFTMGWYLSKMMGMISSTILLGALLWDIHDLYSRLQRINAELHEDSITDGLTGLFQRRYLDRNLNTLSQKNKTVALLLFDVDRFKMYNDKFGHPTGDECLLAVSQAILSCVKSNDGFVARYGGEEIAVVLTGETAEHALAVGEHIRKTVENLHLQHAPEANQNWITVSGGWVLSTEGWRPGELLSKADAALYLAKKQGRNKLLGADALNTDRTHS